ncbi:MAG: PA14 domain-containing protein [Actinomycetota bacterium]
MSDILVIEPNDDDEYAEDAEFDGIEADEEPSKNWLLSIAASVIVSLVLIGETVGGLIGLNSYEPLEYGTGVSSTTACDTALDVLPVSGVQSSETEVVQTLSHIDISGISDECLNKTFTIEMYKSTGPLTGSPVNIGTRMGGTPTSYIRFVLATQPTGFTGLDWKIYPTSGGLPNPSSATGLNTCGGDSNAIDNVNVPTFDWFDLTNPGYGIVCPDDNFLTHMTGFLTIPGTDDGDLTSVSFGLESNGNAELLIGGRTVISDRTSHATSTKNGSILLRKGQTYSIDVWYFKGTGSGSLILSWNRNSSTGAILASPVVVPSSAFTFQSTVGIVIPSSEGVTDYTVTALGLSTNNRSVRINIASRVLAGDANRFTLETSR